MSKLEFHLFNYGAYPYVPYSYDRPKTLYIDLPNKHWDSVLGKSALDTYFDTLAFGEKLGFDGILTTTQMGGPVGMTPSANLAAAYLIAKTSRVKVGTIGPILNTYTSPIRAAEDLALLDVMSGGRLIIGLPMGHGMNYHAAGVMNPTHARDRYWESHDLMVKAFTDDGPFEWQGKYFHVPYANLWPKPIQKPYPDVWIPAAGSAVTLDRAARHKYTYQALFSPRKVLKKNVNTFRDLARKYGYEAGPDQVALVIFIHVAETDAQARLEAEPHLQWLFQNINRSKHHDAFPPGHFSVESIRAAMTGGGYRDRDIGKMTFDQLTTEGWAIIGSPKTVRDQLESITDELGAGKLIHVADLGAMPNWLIRKSLTLMAEEVIPHFRDSDGLPIWAKSEPVASLNSQIGATRETPLEVQQAELPEDGRIAVATAHVKELRKPLRKVEKA